MKIKEFRKLIKGRSNSTIYEALLPFAGSNMVEKSAICETNLKIERFWGKIKVEIRHKDYTQDDLFINLEGNLTRLTGIFDLLDTLKKYAKRRRESYLYANEYFFACTLQGGEVYQ